jgi:murein DD-endopeptidase MepM/ murein hydrolase activator NlpD
LRAALGFAALALLAPAAAPALSSVEAAAAEAKPSRAVIEGVLGAGDSLFASLRQRGVPPEAAQLVARELSGHFDFRDARPGHRYRLVQDGAGRVVDFLYRISDGQSFRLALEGAGYRVTRERKDLLTRQARLAGIVTSTLYRSIVDLGETSQLAADFTEIFAWDIDFSRASHPGDEFRILYERLYSTGPDGREKYVGPGRILAAHYEGRAGDLTAIYFETGPGRGGYFRPDGTSVKRSFLQAPLRYSRITSSFSAARHHPILNVTRPHHGVDYAAPAGTPIWAVADGEVIYRGWAGGYGNLVKLRHAGGYVSYYAHLSSFAKGVRVGDRVEQKQVIGKVGSTGLATGPHVCFRVTRDGRYLDPARLASPNGAPVPVAERYAFYTARDLLLGTLGVEVLGETQPAL